MMTNFDKALEFTLRWEGGYVNDPADPGGETKFGISKRSFPELNIRDLTREQASSIYRRDYWDVFNCDNRPIHDSIAIFDTAVNCGVARTAIWLDGVSKSDPIWMGLLAQREAHYKNLAKKKPLMAKFLKGWMNRLNALHKLLESLTSSSDNSSP